MGDAQWEPERGEGWEWGGTEQAGAGCEGHGCRNPPSGQEGGETLRSTISTRQMFLCSGRRELQETTGPRSRAVLVGPEQHAHTGLGWDIQQHFPQGLSRASTEPITIYACFMVPSLLLSKWKTVQRAQLLGEISARPPKHASGNILFLKDITI